jgi:hypothetical protein
MCQKSVYGTILDIHNLKKRTENSHLITVSIRNINFCLPNQIDVTILLSSRDEFQYIENIKNHWKHTQLG